MPAGQHLQKAPAGWGWLCVVLGLIPVLIALGVVGSNDPGVQAPAWVLVLSGTVFILAGLMILIGRSSRTNHLLAALLCACFGAVGTWVALFAPAEGFSGGIPLISDSINLALGRWMFGLGAVLCFFISVYALRLYFRHSKT